MDDGHIESQEPKVTGTSSAAYSRRGFVGRVGSATLVVLGAPYLLTARSARGAVAKTKRVAFLLPSYAQKRWKAGDQAFFVKEARRLGLDVIVQQANDDETLQASQAENVLTQGVDLIVLCSVNVDTSKGIVDKAKAENVPVIAYNQIIDHSWISAAIARDAVQVGLDLAKAAVAAVPSGNYVLVFGDQGTSVARDKAKGQLQILNPYVKSGKIKIVSERFTAGWSPELAQKQVENALTANGNNVKAVLPSNDGMASGVIQALKAQGLAGKVFVCGEDAEVDALKAIKRGELTASSFTPFNEMGIAGARAAAQILAGEKVTANRTLKIGGKTVPWILIRAFNVNKKNLDQFVAANPWWVRKSQLG